MVTSECWWCSEVWVTGCMYPGCGGMAPMSIRNSLQSPVSSLSMSVSASAMSSVATSPHSSLSLTSDHEQSFSPASGQLMHNQIIKLGVLETSRRHQNNHIFSFFRRRPKSFQFLKLPRGGGSGGVRGRGRAGRAAHPQPRLQHRHRRVHPGAGGLRVWGPRAERERAAAWEVSDDQCSLLNFKFYSFLHTGQKLNIKYVSKCLLTYT